MGNANHIVKGIFGGRRKCAETLGKPDSTVGRWLDGGWIPAWHMADVLLKGQKAGLPISEKDFFVTGGEHGS